MKVCIIHNLYEPFSRGGAEVVVKKTVDHLISLNHQVIVITTNKRNKDEIKKDHHLTVYYLGNAFLCSYDDLNEAAFSYKCLWHAIDIFNIFKARKIVNLIKREQCDVVMTHNLKGLSYFTALYIQKLHVKHVHILHDVQLVFPSGLMFYLQKPRWFERIYAWINKRLFSGITCVVSPSQFLLSFYEQYGFFQNSKRIVIKNPIDDLKGTIEKKEGEIFKFLFVGQLVFHKGITLLLEVFEEMIAQGLLEAKLIVVGDGPLRQELEKTYAKNISFVGKKSKEELAHYYTQSNCVIVPSLCYENDPMVVAESLMYETPVLISNIGGGKERLEDEEGNISYGLLFQAGSKEDLKTKMKQMYEIHLIMRQKIKERKTDEYAVKQYVKRIMEFLEKKDR